MDRCPPPLAVEIPSDDDGAAFSPSRSPPKKRPNHCLGGGGGGDRAEPPIVVISDDPTPQKPDPARTPSFVAETPLSPDPALVSDASIVRCSVARSKPSSDKFSGIRGLICLESENESEGDTCGGALRKSGTISAGLALMDYSEMCGRGCENNRGFWSLTSQVVSLNNENCQQSAEHTADLFICNGSSSIQIVGDSPPHSILIAKDVPQSNGYNDEEHGMDTIDDGNAMQEGRSQAVDADKNNLKNQKAAKKKQLKEEKARLLEERKQKRQQEKLQKEALKAEAAEKKKFEKEKQKWEKGKFAIKSIIAEIDAKVVENGSIGGHLLTRFAEKGLSFRITSNPIKRSILWKMVVPNQIAELSSIPLEVRYIAIVYQAEEFCDLVISESLMDHVHKVRSQYPSFTICYLTNKLMSYINKCEQSQYKNLSNGSCWRRPPVEEVLSKLTTDFNEVHSRQCIDEAELAEHVVGLTSNLANCQFRKKLTWLSVNANGSIIPKDFIDKNLIKRNLWLKALIAIPKVQPRFAIAIWKKYPTMRSLLNVYMDPNKTVHEKEFLLKDLTVEGLLGNEDRRLGEMCSKRVYRILMAQSSGIHTDDVENGADFFGCQAPS